MIKVAINGYGTIGRRVADAVRAQKDMSVAGIVKRKPDYVATEASRNYRIFASDKEALKSFANSNLEAEGTMEELMDDVDIIVDATPEGQGEKNINIYRAKKKKAIFQGGEPAALAEASFNAYGNFVDSWGKDYVRVVSCNTTAMARTVSVCIEKFGVRKVEATIIRRATDPNDSKKGPINAIEPSLGFPSHHGPDLKTVLAIGEANTVAVKVPTTLMHVHVVSLTLEKSITQEDTLDLFRNYGRIITVSGKDGLTSTAQLMDLGKEMGRKRGDMFEIPVWKESIYAYNDNLRYIQAVHQESDVVPENIDAIRSMLQEKDRETSIGETDRALEIRGKS